MLRAVAPRKSRSYRILGGPLRGRVIVASLHDYPRAILGLAEPSLISWMQDNVLPGQTWLDVGAHVGYTTIALADRVGAGGNVYAFEPSLTTVGHLNETCRLNRMAQVTVVPFGLGEPGDLRIASARIERGMAIHDAGVKGSETTIIVCFDDFWEGIKGGPVDGVKIDVQGMEQQVLAGMTRTLSRCHPRLVIEFHAGADRSQILTALDRLGYASPGQAIDPLTADQNAQYRDDRSYAFFPR